MSWKKLKKKLKKAAKAVTKVAPKITVGKDLGAKNLGKAGTSLYKSAGNVGSQLVKTIGKGTEGIVANTADIGAAALKGDFKGIGKEGLELLQSGKDVLKGTANAGITASLAGVKAVGEGTGSKDIVKGATNVEREAQKGVNKYGDIAADLGLSAIPGVGQAYALTKAGLGATSKDGLKGLTSVEGLTDMALGAAASKFNINPNAIAGAKMGLSAAKGDLKGAALQGLGSFAGLNPDEMKMASTGVSALTGDKKGLASGLASQFGAGDSVANMVGAAAGGKKSDIISSLGGQLGLDPKKASTLDAAASGDLKGAALQSLGSLGSLKPDVLKGMGLESLSKIDTKDLQKYAKMAESGVSALTGDKAGLASGLASQFGAGDLASDMIGKFAGGQGGREVLSDAAGAYAKDEANRMLNEQIGRAGMDRTQLKELEEKVGQVTRAPAALQAAAESTYKIAAGDTLSAIAKKMGTTVAELQAANPQIKDINKIAAGASLNLPGAVKQAAGMIEGARASITDKFLKDASGKTIMGPNNAPIPNPSYNQEEADKLAMQQQGGTGKEITLPEEKGFLDTAKDFIGENKGLLGGAAQVAGAVGGYAAAASEREKQQKLTEQQLKDVQGIGGEFAGQKYDPERYTQEREFRKARIAGGGVTAEERKMQQEGDIRAARAAAAQRLAGMEQQARLGGSAVGTSALAAALSGAQAGQNIQAETNLSREATASQRLEQDIEKQSQLSSKQTAEEAELAKQQSSFALDKAKQVGAERENLSNLSAARAKAAADLAGTLTDTAVGAIQSFKSPEEQEKEDEQKRQAEEQKRQAEEQKRQAEEQRKKQEMDARSSAAQKLGSTPPPPQTSAQPARPTAQPATGKPGEGYGVLQSSMGTVQTAQGALQKASDTFNQFNQKAPAQAQPVVQQIGKGIQQAQNVVQQGQKVAQQAQQVQQTVDKAKDTYEQFTKNPLGAFGVKL